ncbi:MAG: hypothetical protein JNL67_07880 [Planctomycetaceae bacterium]|nr:hypothetical protein [Planctomycetaceae bacterium]
MNWLSDFCRSGFPCFAFLVFGWIEAATWGQVVDDESSAKHAAGWSVTGRPESGYATYELPSTSWQFRRADQQDWQAATVPAPWEDFLGTTFDGRGTYRLSLTAGISQQIADWRRQQEASLGPCEWFVVFDGVATQAVAKFNGQLVGSHLGPWTPWSCSIESVWKDAGPNVLEVEVDERVGHHTQGFLPVFLPHFGGIWQSVRLELRPVQRINANDSLVLGNFSPDGRHEILVDLELHVRPNTTHRVRFTVSPPHRRVEHRTSENSVVRRPVWEIHPTLAPQTFEYVIEPQQLRNGRWQAELPLPGGQPWSPDAPWLYGIQVELLATEDSQAEPAHTAWFRTGIRRYETRGHQMLLNGDPVVIQGLLNWGFTPSSLAPTLDENLMLSELQAARRLGANLMKYCLWIPPKRYLELADECGMLTWIEYPTWHAQLIQANLNDLSREYAEFTNFDRNHPSVILRSLTCETGSSAELSVIQHLYDLVHRQVPGAIVEDDSSWISWNRVSDIWDDHPYGNNHTWVASLQQLREYIQARQAKPLVLGEAIAADTWPDFRTMAAHEKRHLAEHPWEEQPFWAFGFSDSGPIFEQKLANVAGVASLARLRSDSIRYAYLMRKYQVETYRREVPWGGYVLSVIRDFPFAGMGLLDTFGANKFSEWDVSGQFALGPSMLLLRSAGDRRSWFGGDTAELHFLLATTGRLPTTAESSRPAKLEWKLIDTKSNQVMISGEVPWSLHRPDLLSATVQDHPQVALPIKFPAVEELTEVTLQATATIDADRTGENQQVIRNQWPLWLVPTLVAKLEPQPVAYSVDSTLAADPSRWLKHPSLTKCMREIPSEAGQGSAKVILASRFSLRLLDELEAGAKVLMFPDGQSFSLPTQSHWFLRGGPIMFSHPALGATEQQQSNYQDALRDLQHFDLAGQVQPQQDYWSECSPVLALWDNHDIKDVRVHGLVWEAQVGQGRLLVSLLNHDPSVSAIGPRLLLDLVQHLQNDFEPKVWGDDLRRRLREDLMGRDINLVTEDWRLRPDSDQVGFQANWADAELEDQQVASAWQPIRIDAHWEGQGHTQLDGWAWYATDVLVPQDWSSDSLYLCFSGVDDHYQAFVNGDAVGSAGVIETKETAFEMRTSHRLPETVKAGEKIKIRIAVYDWYGAGGIFRPIYLRTTPWSNARPILNR